MKIPNRRSIPITILTAAVALSQPPSAPGIDLGLLSEITGSAPLGGLTVSHTVWNFGNETVTNIWLTNTVPPGVSFILTSQWPPGSPGPTYPPPPDPPILRTAIAPGTTFATPITAINPAAVAVAISDLDRDGRPDLIVAHGTNDPSITLYRATSGCLTCGPISGSTNAVPTNLPVPHGARVLNIGDFNGDGLPDIVCADAIGNGLTTFLQTSAPDGIGFAPGPIYDFPTPATALEVMDFDGDGYDDLVVLESASQTIHLLQNTTLSGAPGFMVIGTLPTPPAPTALGKEKKRPGRESPALASLGRLFVTSDDDGGTVAVYIPTGASDPVNLFLPPVILPCGPTPRAIAVGDLDGDGLEDLAVANGPARTITLLRADAMGGYTSVGAQVCDAASGVPAVHLLDLDGDGRPELITGSVGQPDCIVIPNSRSTDPLHLGQFGTPVHFPLPAPLRNLGFDAFRDGSQAGGLVVVGHAGPGQGSLAEGQSFSLLGLTHPAALVAVPLGDLAPGQATGVLLDLEVRVWDATNTALARGPGGSSPPVSVPIKIPLREICGALYCVSGGVTQGMGGFSVSVVINGTGYYFSNSTVTLPNGTYCIELPFSCGGIFPWDTTITVSSPACPGQVLNVPLWSYFASASLPALYCGDCNACTNIVSVLNLFSGAGSSGLLAIGSLDPQFVTGVPPFANANPYVTTDTGWLPNGPSSQWVGPDLMFQSPAGVYCYTNTFYLPCTNSALLSGQWTIAGEGVEVLLNGAPTGISLTGFGLEANWWPFNLNSGFVAGWNTLVFCVTNPVSTIGLPANPTGLRTEIAGRATCCAGCAEIRCPTNIVVEVCTNGPAPYGQVVNYTPPAAFSHCGPITNVICLPPSGSFFGLGTNTVTCTATDSLGNSAACSFKVIVRPDFTPPMFQCPPLNVSVTGCPPVMPDFTTNIFAIDNCSSPLEILVTQDIPPGTPLPLGPTVVIIRVCDAAGNCQDCDVIVTGVLSADCCTTAPMLSLFSGANPSGLLPANSLDPQFATGAPLFSTAYPVVMALIHPWWLPNNPSSQWIGSDPSWWANLPGGVYVYTNRFFLCSTNQAEITGRWTADDSGEIWLNGAPTGNVLPAGWAFMNWYPVSITSGFVPGWNELTFRVTNYHWTPTALRTELTGTACCPNFSCVSLTCPSDIVETICGNTGMVSYPAPTVNSTCNLPPTVECVPPGPVFPLGTTTVTCGAVDPFGNTASCSFTVTLQGHPPLTVLCPPDLTLVRCGANPVGNYTASIFGGLGPYGFGCTPPSGSTFPLGTNTVTCTAIDNCGTVATCSFRVIVRPPLTRWECWQVGIGIPIELVGGATASFSAGGGSEGQLPTTLSIVPAAGVPNSGALLHLGSAQAITFTTVLDFTAPVGAGFDLVLPPDPLHPKDPPILSLRNKGPKGYAVKMNKRFADEPGALMRAFAVNTNGALLDPLTFTPDEVEANGVFDIGFQPGVTNCHVTIELDCLTGAMSVEIPGPIVPSALRKGWDGCIYGPDRPVKKPKQTARVTLIPPVSPGQPPITDLYLYASGGPEVPIEEPSITASGRKWGDGHVILMKAYDEGESLEFAVVGTGGGVQVDLGHTESFDLRLTRFETNLPPGEELLTRTFGPIRGLTNRPSPPVLDSMLLQSTDDGVECSVDFNGLESPTVQVLIYNSGALVFARSNVLGQLGQAVLTLPEWPSTLGKLGGRAPCRVGTIRTGSIRLPGSGGAGLLALGGVGGEEIVVGDEFRIVAEMPEEAPRPDYYSAFEFFATEGADWGISELQRVLACTPVPVDIVRGGDGITVTWAGEDFRLQGADNVTGPWLELGAQSPVSLGVNHPARFFRLLCD